MSAQTQSLIEANIFHDDSFDPRQDHEPMGKLVCAHRGYALSDEGALETLKHQVLQHRDLDRLLEKEELDLDHLPHLEQAAEALGIFAVKHDVYLYDHSGLAMSIRPFHCPWDSGKVGFIYVTQEDLEREYLGCGHTQAEAEAKAGAYMEGEVAEMDHYLAGRVWGFELTDSDGEVHCVGGYIGDDFHACGIADQFEVDSPEYEALKQAWEDRV